jgi:hypothetical protein
LRRVRIIYSPLGLDLGAFGCRLCLGLIYRSWQEHRQWAYETLIALAERLERRRWLRELTALIEMLPRMVPGA